MHKFQPVRGTKDLFAAEILLFDFIIKTASKAAQTYNFEKLQTPIFEFSEVFERNLGETSDIVTKEVYRFKDRSDNNLTLRPEFTAAIVRALVSNSELLQVLPKKFFSYGPVFRYDRPQKGRARQFHQINFEIFGAENAICDVEAIILANSILQSLGVDKKITLQINSLGDLETKKAYETALFNYFNQKKSSLSADSINRLEKNPLRILDSKSPQDIEMFDSAPKISDFYSSQAKKRFTEILQILTTFSLDFVVNERLVRGLDYYSSTVFEFIYAHEGAQNALLAGGRYDGLVEKFCGKKVPAFGFAAGIERLMLLCDLEIKAHKKIAVIYVSENERFVAFEISQMLRKSGLDVDFAFDESFKKQMKKASQAGVSFAVIIGEEEVKNKIAAVKNFFSGEEQKIAFEKLSEWLA